MWEAIAMHESIFRIGSSPTMPRSVRDNVCSQGRLAVATVKHMKPPGMTAPAREVGISKLLNIESDFCARIRIRYNGPTIVVGTNGGMVRRIGSHSGLLTC